jgi:hypothetical protein
VLAGGALQLLVRPDVRVGEPRGSLYGLLINSYSDRPRPLVGYGFDRNKVMLPSQPHEPSREDIHEAQLPIVIDVEVRYIAEEPIAEVQDALLAKLALRGGGMLVALQPDQVHGASLPCLLTLITLITKPSGFYASRVT